MLQVPTLEDIWDDDERRKQHIHWTFVFSQLIAQWAQWLGVWYFFFSMIYEDCVELPCFRRM